MQRLTNGAAPNLDYLCASEHLRPTATTTLSAAGLGRAPATTRSRPTRVRRVLSLTTLLWP